MSGYAGGGGKKKAKKSARKTGGCSPTVCCKTGEKYKSVQLSSPTRSEGKIGEKEHCSKKSSCVKKD